MQKSELDYFKTMLEKRKRQILKNIKGVHDEIDQLGTCEVNDDVDLASLSNSSMVEGVIEAQQMNELREINVALERMASGEYGTCAMCGIEIGFQRLKVKPHAIYCIDCHEILEKTEKV